MAAIGFDAKGQHWYSTGIRNGFLCIYDSALEEEPKEGWTMQGVGSSKFIYNDKFGDSGNDTLARKHGIERYPWSGLISVNSQNDGGENNAIYADDVKYLNLMSEENAKFTIEAYQSPEQFDECDGTYNIINGLGFYEQPRKKFDFGFITQMSNEDGITEIAYSSAVTVPCEQLHIYYNCTAAPSDRQYSTMNDSPEAITLSWDVTAEPVIGKWFSKSKNAFVDFKTSHLVIDTRRFANVNVARQYNTYRTRLLTQMETASCKWTHMPSVLWQVFNAYTMLGQEDPGANW